MDRGAWWATVHGVRKDSDMTERVSPGPGAHTHTHTHTHTQRLPTGLHTHTHTHTHTPLAYWPVGPLCWPLLDTTQQPHNKLRTCFHKACGGWNSAGTSSLEAPPPALLHHTRKRPAVTAHRSHQLQKLRVSGKHTPKFTGFGIQILLFQFWPNPQISRLNNNAAKLVWWVTFRLRFIFSPDSCPQVDEKWKCWSFSLTLCDPMVCRPPGSSVHGTQARTLEWVAMPSPRWSSWPRDRTHILHCQAGSLPLVPPGTLKSHSWNPSNTTSCALKSHLVLLSFLLYDMD